MLKVRNLDYYYKNRIKKDLIEKFNYTNNDNIPALKNIYINVGVKSAVINKKNLVPVLLSLELISGQQAIVTYAKVSVATFKLKKNMPIGCKVKLNNYKASLFMLKLIMNVLPNIKEFVGFKSKNFDGKGNFAFGIEDLTIFPEIYLIYDKFEINSGMNIIITTTANTNKEAKLLLSGYNFPFIN
jgi:large subunit ribosomal protein L5